MTDTEINIAIAEECGKLSNEDWDFIEQQAGKDWWLESGKFYFRNGGSVDSCHTIPNYITDLNAMHEAEKLITTQLEWDKYHFQLRYVVCAGADINRQLAAYNNRDVTTATYEQRLEALCRVWYPERFKY